MQLGPKSHIKAKLAAADAGFPLGKIGEEKLEEWDDVMQVLTSDWTDEDGFDEDGYQWDWSSQWEMTCGTVRSHMRRVNPKGRGWFAYATDYNWHHANGHKYFRAEEPEKLLEAVLHRNTEHRWELYDYTDQEGRAGLALTFSNHDVHSAWVYIVPTDYDPEIDGEEDDEEGEADVTD